MSKYHDDTATASNPGGVRLSLDKLRLLQPELLTDVSLMCGTGCAKLHPAEELRERIDEHLRLGDSRAAIVVSLNPLLVGAFSDDLDTVALLKFPEQLVQQYGLTVHSRLLAVNTYGKSQDRHTGALLIAADLVPGPRHTNMWSNFQPYIAEFLSDDADRIEALKARIAEEEWNDARRLAAIRLEALGTATAREGAPIHCASPVPNVNGQAWKRLLPAPAQAASGNRPVGSGNAPAPPRAVEAAPGRKPAQPSKWIGLLVQVIIFLAVTLFFIFYAKLF